MKVSIDATVCRKLGLASHQNAVPLLHEITLTNKNFQSLEDLRLEFEPTLPFAAPKTWRIDRLSANSVTRIGDRDIDLKEGYLADLSESMQASVQLRLCVNAAVLVEQRIPVEVLARNDWGGSGTMPELLAVFCSPNDPAVDRVLKGASDVLRRAGRPDGIDGYRERSRQRAWELTSALWSAICGYQISYTLPPASFAHDGQRIRTPTQILDSRVGTCLDTALLFAAAVEQAGLNPVVVLTKGHAFTGVWLQSQEFAQVLVEDASTVRKRVELQELLVFETTLVTRSPPTSFSQAIGVAKQELTNQDFVMAVDVRRARMQKLRPLSVTVRAVADNDAANAPKVSEALEVAPELPCFDSDDEADGQSATPNGRLELWQRKLLDLTTRNRLLHLPEAAKALHLVCPDPAGLEDILAANKSVRIVSMPELAVGGRDRRIYQQRTHEDLEKDVAAKAMARHEVLCKLDKSRLGAELVDLYRKARSDLEEGGSNTLFLAVGFLNWKKSESDSKVYNAPLLLLPVKLERRSALSSVTMKMFDDEPRFNLTLLELLRHDFQLDIRGLSGDLPTDASGVDVSGIWNIVRRAVRDMPGFEVTTDVVLGRFSFAKYLMWRDLIDRSEQLMQSDVVRQLLLNKAGQSLLEHTGEFPAPAKLDAEVNPRELFTPLPADSSQLAAIVASAKGYSFVLDGPPGTGKSQTIANMIAHNLALGRRVLFVSEKMAALDVVKRRLEEKAIGPFCLELHSTKSTKTHVLQQLDRAWMARGTISEKDWNTRADEVRSLRDRLNQFVSVLHKRWPNGWSVYQAIGLVVRDSNPAVPRLSWPASIVHDATQMEKLRDIAHRLELNRDAAKRKATRLSLLVRTEWSNIWQETMVAAARQALDSIAACDEACAQVLQVTGLPLKRSTSMLGKLPLFVRLLPEAYDVDLRFAFSPESRTVQTAAQQALSLLSEYEALERRLSLTYAQEAIRHIDVDKLRNDWVRASGKRWFFATLGKKRVAKALRTIAVTPQLPDVEADLPLLTTMKALVAKVDDLDGSLRTVPGWASLGTNTTRMTLAVKLADNLHSTLVTLADSPERLVELRHAAERLVVTANDLLAPDGEITVAVARLQNRHTMLLEATARFAKSAGREIDLARRAPELLAGAQAVIENDTSLKAWCSWQRVRAQAVACDLLPLVEAIENDTLPDGSVANAFEVAYARWFASGAIDAEPLLCHFVAKQQQSDVQAFSNAVDKLCELSAEYVCAKLSGNIPDKNGISQRSGFGILKHELQKQRRHKSVRRLSEEMGRDFTALAPCMLMSPLSVAQFLPADHELFDLVIFDEASQITPWDAVGAIARGKQVVIAGDRNQMPPTNFFNRGACEEDDDIDTDLESILDECIGASMREHSLTWHYRSRHESLITFSNHTYYDDSLITFPAPDTRPSAVSWRKIDGVYARGAGGGRNPAEAKAIVAEVVHRLTDPDFLKSGQSIGIITLNAQHQQLVADLLDQARREHREIEPFFDAELPEPVVVKNLETMQGDERDLIILGIGFGPTVPGTKTMSLNFGPLNRSGGWRRLNVAVTRARRQMMVFTSFDPSMIDLNRTSARAMRDLRHFIEFAQQGPQAIAAAVHGSLGGYESPFEEFVADGLRRKGWETHCQIGVSRFRIDLGVVHPDRPGDYLVGIECDGATYHSAATARDRDKIRAEILRGLGWQLLRVWSTDWWVDPSGTLDRLDQSLKTLLQTSRTKSMNSKRGPKTQGAGVRAEKDGHRDVGVDTMATHDVSDSRSPVSSGTEVEPREDEAASMRLVARQAIVHDEEPSRQAYHKADLSSFASDLRPGDFQEPAYDVTLSRLVDAVLGVEAPILDAALVWRIARVHGFKRCGRLIRNRVLGVARRRYYFQRESDPDRRIFIWLTADDPGRWNVFRTPEHGEDIRSVGEIPLAELRAAARSITSGDPAVDVARAFKVRRLSEEARARIGFALHIPAASGSRLDAGR